MKKLLSLKLGDRLKAVFLAGAMCLAGLAADAGTDFTTGTGATNALNVLSTNIVVFPAVPGRQFVLYNVNYQTATNGSLLMASGTTAFYQTSSNLTSTTVTNRVNSTNGFVPGRYAVLDRGGTAYVASIAAVGQSTNANTFGTNIVLTTGGWGVATVAGDAIYQLGVQTALPLLAATGTNSINGSAIFVGELNRPVVLMIGPAMTPSALSGSGEYR